MKQYFEKMDPLGKPLSAKQIESMQENRDKLEEIMRTIDAEVERIKNVGVPLQTLHDRGEMSVWERIDYLVDPGTFCPLHSIFDPENEESGSTGVVDGLAQNQRQMVRAHRLQQQVDGRAPGLPDSRTTTCASRTSPRFSISRSCGWSTAPASNCPNRKKCMPTAAARAPVSSATRNSNRWASPSSPAFTAPIPRAAAISRSAPPFCWRTRKPTWPWAAAAS